ncbi:MAG: hypothetical protein GW928_10380 [Rhodoferax sp.]|nr:hypothetical protein [Rhodoferax sp.]
MEFLKGVIEADGKIDEREEFAIEKMARLGNLWVDFDGSIVGDRIHD